MSDNLSFSLDRAIVFRSEEAGSVDPDLVKPLPEEPVDLLRRNLILQGQSCSLRTDQPDFSTNIFKSNIR